MGAIADGLGTGFAILAVVCGAITIVLIFTQLVMVALHLALRRRGLADEARRLAQPLPAEDQLPHVVVQIPTYNEGTLIERALAAATQFDWPKDRLHIQVCDDSTDGSIEHARAAAARFVASGIDIVVLHRANRQEFKAGALRAAMEVGGYPYYAIFDVDFIPQPDFLRRCMAVLLGDAKLAFVQALPSFLNPDENELTRAQAVALDTHHAVDQATRSWAGFPLPFNGTCGIWRRAAIEAGGGWRGETLAEDLDLSYRARFEGWRGIFLTSVAVPGELPADWAAFSGQQRRWILGTGQVAISLLPGVLLTRGLTLRERLGAIIHIGSWWSTPVSALTIQAAIVAILFKPDLLPWLGMPILAIAVCGAVLLIWQFRIANRFLRDPMPWPAFLRTYATILRLAIKLGWENRDVVWKVVLGRKTTFVRTEKQGSLPNSELGAPKPSAYRTAE